MEDHDNSFYRVRCDDQYSALLGSISTLFREEAFIDATIFADGKLFKAHRIILSVSSPYLKHVLLSVPGEHAVLLLPHINSNDFGNVLKFIYEGEVTLSQKDLKSFLQVSRLLKIKGFDFEQDYANEIEGMYKKEDAAPVKGPPRPRPSPTTLGQESRSSNDQCPAVVQDECEENDYSNVAATPSELRRSEVAFNKTNLGNYDERDGTHLGRGEVEDEEPDNTGVLGDSDEGPDDGFPLMPDVSMEVIEDSFHMKNEIKSDIQIITCQSLSSRGSTWGIPHSSTSSTHRGSHGWPWSSMTSLSPHSQSQAGYEVDETRMKGTKSRPLTKAQCGCCKKVLSSLPALKRHMEDKHSARIRGKCLLCSRVYSSRNSLLNHVYSAHREHPEYKAVVRIIRYRNFETLPTS